MDAEMHRPSDYHADDRRFAKRIERYIAESLKLGSAMLVKRGLSAPKPLRDEGGLSFNASFQRSVPGIGKLGGDCLAIEPVLPVLDRILVAAKQKALSDYVDPDPNRWVKGKTPWFDAAAGLRGRPAAAGRACPTEPEGEEPRRSRVGLDRARG